MLRFFIAFLVMAVAWQALFTADAAATTTKKASATTTKPSATTKKPSSGSTSTTAFNCTAAEYGLNECVMKLMKDKKMEDVAAFLEADFFQKWDDAKTVIDKWVKDKCIPDYAQPHMDQFITVSTPPKFFCDYYANLDAKSKTAIENFVKDMSNANAKKEFEKVEMAIGEKLKKESKTNLDEFKKWETAMMTACPQPQGGGESASSSASSSSDYSSS